MKKSIDASVRLSVIRDRLIELDAIETRSTEQESELQALMASGRRRNSSTAPRRRPKGKRSCIVWTSTCYRKCGSVEGIAPRPA